MVDNGRTSVDEGHSGCLSTSQTVDNAEQVNALVQENRWITVTDEADKLAISCGSAYSIIHKDFEYNKICARWMSEQLTDEHKQARMERCMQFL
jgi:hypothetical protein